MSLYEVYTLVLQNFHILANVRIAVVYADLKGLCVARSVLVKLHGLAVLRKIKLPDEDALSNRGDDLVFW